MKHTKKSWIALVCGGLAMAGLGGCGGDGGLPDRLPDLPDGSGTLIPGDPGQPPTRNPGGPAPIAIPLPGPGDIPYKPPGDTSFPGGPTPEEILKKAKELKDAYDAYKEYFPG